MFDTMFIKRALKEKNVRTHYQKGHTHGSTL